DFADIGEYFDRPVKIFSSGMMVRLAFGIYINLEPEILIVDEALSVGDFFFQKKCAAAVRAVRERGTTILLATHDTAAVHEFCDEVILLSHGAVQARGDANTVIGRYHVDTVTASGKVAAAPAVRSAAIEAASDKAFDQSVASIRADDLIAGAESSGGHGASLRALRIVDQSGAATLCFAAGSVLRLEAVIEFHRSIPHANLGVLIADSEDRNIWSAATSSQEVWFGAAQSGDLVAARLDVSLDVTPGRYFITVATAEVDPLDPSHAVWNDTRLKFVEIEVVAAEQFANRSGLAYLDMDLCTL
ncbi:MAG: Wzt carbohydrate-binding domain-containing protein, partial [Hyphomicrobium sp.]|nr:Wzt carbohydrate-binding domain-containing protein [Hyphomicrobium sp.]